MVSYHAYAVANSAPSRACMMSGMNTPKNGVYTLDNSERGDAKTRKIIPTPNRDFLGMLNNWTKEVNAPVPSQRNPLYDNQIRNDYALLDGRVSIEKIGSGEHKFELKSDNKIISKVGLTKFTVVRILKDPK